MIHVRLSSCLSPQVPVLTVHPTVPFFVPNDSLQSDRCAEMLKALAEPIRLRMVDVLRAGPRNVGEIASALDIEIVNASHHLKILKHAALVTSRREGRHIVYRLAEGVFNSRSGGRASRPLNPGCCR